jgi:voltage-gated potassium channel Kch
VINLVGVEVDGVNDVVVEDVEAGVGQVVLVVLPIAGEEVVQHDHHVALR